MHFACLFFHLSAFQMEPAQERALAFEMARRQVQLKDDAPQALNNLKQKMMTERFNRLVDAVEAFSKAYNGSKGQVWPADKAKALQKAMKDLQEIEPSFKASAKP